MGVDSKITEAPAGTADDISVWVPGRAPAGAGDPDERLQGAVLWCDLKPGTSAREAHASLEPRFEGLTQVMLEQLLSPDEEARVDAFNRGAIRTTSACAVRCEDVQSGTKQDPVGALVVEPIELLASGRWLVTYRHAAHRQFGFEEDQLASRVDPRMLHDAVARRWRSVGARTGGDLGVLVMRELALTYAPAVRKLRSWLEDWELALFEDDATSEQLAAHRKSLRELWALRAVLRNWINPLNRPGIEEDPDKAWLPISDHEGAKLVDDHIDGALRELARLGDTLRDSFRVLHTEELEKERQRREGVQRRIEVIAAIFLVPSFIVGFYGANTWIPGEHREWGLAVMLGVMVLLTAIAVAVLVRTRD